MFLIIISLLDMSLYLSYIPRFQSGNVLLVFSLLQLLYSRDKSLSRQTASIFFTLDNRHDRREGTEHLFPYLST